MEVDTGVGRGQKLCIGLCNHPALCVYCGERTLHLLVPVCQRGHTSYALAFHCAMEIKLTVLYPNHAQPTKPSLNSDNCVFIGREFCSHYSRGAAGVHRTREMKNESLSCESQNMEDKATRADNIALSDATMMQIEEHYFVLVTIYAMKYTNQVKSQH